MESFKDNKGRRYIAINKAEHSKIDAVKIANVHFKKKKEDLIVQTGKMIDEETIKIGCRGDLWVVSRRFAE